MKNHYIIIDDESLHNLICEVNIKKADSNSKTISFTYPPEAISYLRKEYRKKSAEMIVLVDLVMPEMDGIEVLEELSTFIHPGFDHIHVYVLSSSIEEELIEQAKSFPLVRGFIEKPLTTEKIEELLTWDFHSSHSET
ncbi:MAG: response regulator [Bacteroidetes bacterium]|nr:response regulator [Bacteroidota bacterium]